MKAEEIDIIDNYSRLTIGMHASIMDACNDASLDELDTQVRIISILTGLSEDEIMDLPIMEYSELASKTTFLQREVEPTSVARSYLVGDFELVPVMDMRKITTAQYIDFQSFHKAGLETHFAEVLSCLLVPKGEKYNQNYDVIEVQKAIREDMSVRDGCSLYAFFLVSSRQSIQDILTFSLEQAKGISDKSKREAMIAQIQEQMNLLTSGVGLPT